MHTAGVTTGKVHDAKVMDRLIREDDEAVYGDKAYASEAKKRFRLRAGVRVQRHRDDKRGPALRSFYNNFCPHLLGQNLDQARAKTGWLVQRERIRQADAFVADFLILVPPARADDAGPST